MKKIFLAWAIKMQIDGHANPNFMGIFYCVRGLLEDCQDGMRTCLFRTRQQARKVARENASSKAKVVQVKVTIEAL